MRHRLFYLAFALVPLAAYFPVLLAEYGLAGDYQVLRLSQAPSAATETSWGAVGETVLYRALLDSSFKTVDRVDSLWILRLGALALMAVLGALLWRQLDGSGWPEADAAAVGLLIVLLPAAQVITGWALCWPRAMALLFAVAGFAAVETELEAGGLKRVVAMLGGVFIYALSAMIRPELVFFALVPLVGVLLFKIRKAASTQSLPFWYGLHMVVLLVGYLSGRILEHWASEETFVSGEGVAGALRWLVLEAVPGALALVVVRTESGAGPWYFWLAAVIVAAAIAFLFRMDPSDEGQLARKRVVTGLMLASAFLIAPLLTGSMGPRGYRDAYPLAALAAVMFIAGWRAPLRAKRVKSWMHSLGLVGIVAMAALLAHFNVTGMISEPQSNEWKLVKNAISVISFKGQVRIAVIQPDSGSRPAGGVQGTALGVVSSADEATLRQMVASAVHQRYPAGIPRGVTYEVTVVAAPPEPGSFEALIDLRRLSPQGG